MVLRVPICFPHFSPQGEGSKDQISATLLIKMKVFIAYEAPPTGGKWGRMGEGWGKTQDMVLRVPPCFPTFPHKGKAPKRKCMPLY